MADDDPFEDFYKLEPNEQVVVFVTVLRQMRAAQRRVEKKLDWVLRTLWVAVATALITGFIQVWVNQTKTPPVGGTHSGMPAQVKK